MRRAAHHPLSGLVRTGERVGGNEGRVGNGLGSTKISWTEQKRVTIRHYFLFLNIFQAFSLMKFLLKFSSVLVVRAKQILTKLWLKKKTKNSDDMILFTTPMFFQATTRGLGNRMATESQGAPAFYC